MINTSIQPNAEPTQVCFEDHSEERFYYLFIGPLIVTIPATQEGQELVSNIANIAAQIAQEIEQVHGSNLAPSLV